MDEHLQKIHEGTSAIREVSSLIDSHASQLADEVSGNPNAPYFPPGMTDAAAFGYWQQYIANGRQHPEGVPNLPDPPPPPSTPDGELIEKGLHIWNERSPANDLGFDGAIVWATHGEAGQQTVRIIYANGDMSPAPKAYETRTIQAKKEGCVAVALDLESYLLASGSDNCAQIYQACRQYLPVIWVPKVYLDHLASSWPNINSFRGRVQWLKDYGDGILPWIYNLNGDGWISQRQGYGSAGYNKWWVPLCEFVRTWDGARPLTANDVSKIYAAEMGIGVFAPIKNNHDLQIIKSSPWQRAIKLYG